MKREKLIRFMFSIKWLLLFIALFTYSVKGLASTKSLELSGDILQIAIPVVAFGTTLGLKDFKGSQEFLMGFAATSATTYGLKYMINERRPHGGSHSFPSGHTAIAFFGSGFIQKRYGWRYAIPAYAAALYVGYTRIKIKEHWIQDVVGGAAIGLLYSYLLTTPYQENAYRFYPSMTSNSLTLYCEKNF